MVEKQRKRPDFVLSADLVGRIEALRDSIQAQWNRARDLAGLEREVDPGSGVVGLIPGFENNAFNKLVGKGGERSHAGDPALTAAKLGASIASPDASGRLTREPFSKVLEFRGWWNDRIVSDDWRALAADIRIALGFAPRAEDGGGRVAGRGAKPPAPTPDQAAVSPITGRLASMVEELATFGVAWNERNTGGARRRLLVEFGFGHSEFNESDIRYLIVPDRASIRVGLATATLTDCEYRSPYDDSEQQRLKIIPFRSGAFGWFVENSRSKAPLIGRYRYFDLCGIDGELVEGDTVALCFADSGFKIVFEDEAKLESSVDPYPLSLPAHEARRLIDAWIMSRRLELRPNRDGLYVLHAKALCEVER